MKKTLIANQLEKEIAFFEGHPERWTQMALAMDAYWRTVHPNSPNAICFCQEGNRLRACPPPKTEADHIDVIDVDDLVDAVANSMGYTRAIDLNDGSDFNTVMEMLYVAFEHAKGAEV